MGKKVPLEIFDGKEVSGPQLLPYVAIRRMFRRVYKGVEYIVAIYGAYSAFGLIGPEKNGIVVLDNTNKRVIADEIARESSGYYGASAAQIQLFQKLYAKDGRDLLAWVKKQPTCRPDM